MKWVTNSNTGTKGAKDFDFPSEESLKAHVVLLFTKDDVLSDDVEAIKYQIQSILKTRGIDCTSLRMFINLPKSEVGTSFVRIDICSGAKLTDEQAAALETTAE